MKRPEMKPDFNSEAIKRMTKEVFIESHKEAYPDLNLSKEYDKITGKSTEDKK